MTRCSFVFLLLSLLSLSPSRAQLPANSAPAPAPAASPASEYYEDFSVLSLQSSSFFPLPPALGQTDDNPQNSFIRQRWQLAWRPADPLDVFVVKPRGVKNPPVILYLYTYPGNTDRFKSDDWCAAVTSQGFAAVGFLSAFTGHRLEMRSVQELFLPQFQEALASTVHDVQLILNYLQSRGDLDMHRVGMFGQGSGGSIAILAAATDPRIHALDVLDPWADWPDFFAATPLLSTAARSRYTSSDFLSSIAPLDPVLWLPKVKSVAIRIQNVRKPSPVPPAAQQRLEAAAPSLALINQFGDSSALVPHASGGALFTWMKDQLQPAAQPTVLAASERVHFYPARASENPLPPVAQPAAPPIPPPNH